MKISRWILAATLAAAVAPSDAFAADQGAQTMTFHFPAGIAFGGETTNPCTGQAGTLVLTVQRGVDHVTATPSGRAHENATQTGTAAFTPDGAATPTFTGTFTNTTDTLRVDLRAADGARVSAHAVRDDERLRCD